MRKTAAIFLALIVSGVVILWSKPLKLSLRPASATCIAGLPNPHPHVIRDGADAISTFFANWSATTNDPARLQNLRDTRDWLKYEAHYERGKWHLIPHPRADEAPGRGIHIWIDGQTGCTVSELASD